MTYDFAVLSNRRVLAPFPPHLHEDYAIAVTEGGAHRIRVGHRYYDAPAGAVVAIGPYQLHSADSASGAGWSYRMLFVGEEVMRALAGSDGPASKPPVFLRPVIVDASLARAIRRLHRHREQTAPAPSLALSERTVVVLSRLLETHGDVRPNDGDARVAHRGVRRAREYLHAHSERPISLAELAGIAALHPRYLVRVFSASVGLPPHAYLKRLRIARAQRMLTGGDPLARVAQAAGFADQSHLTREFRRYLGVTPGVYAQRNRWPGGVKFIQDAR
ncbi:MAG TPA: AraC family transcriptional regulator [Gemmatimonadaceae bacterium]|nr:AraC family transcriptional regulator [Gemmatimonadaceae bacterium]